MAKSSAPTVLECAELSADVYYASGSVGKWTRFGNHTFSDDGFYGASYRETGTANVIVAVRGTQESQDAKDDAYMAPIITGTRAEHAMMKMVTRYLRGRRSPGALNNMPQLAQKIMGARVARKTAENHGNQIPPVQAATGIRFMNNVLETCKKEKLDIQAITGHSLGGGLTQYLSEQTGTGGLIRNSPPIPGVAFNSPFMGSMKGMHYKSGGGILIVNCSLDPLSFLTQHVGNSSHATLGTVVLEPVPYAKPAPELPPKPTIPEFKKFVAWLLPAMKHYHSMDEMVKLVRKQLGDATIFHTC